MENTTGLILMADAVTEELAEEEYLTGIVYEPPKILADVARTSTTSAVMRPLTVTCDKPLPGKTRKHATADNI